METWTRKELEQAFDEIPECRQAKAFGVNYVKVPDPMGGALYVTRHGWPYIHYLLPDVWFLGDRYSRQGLRLVEGTGCVFRLRVSPVGRPRAEFVVKVSRFAEHVPLFIPNTLPDDLPSHLAEDATFNSPFEEFGLLEELRQGLFGPPELRILTKRPLAIYCSPVRHQMWQLGRTKRSFHGYEKALQLDQVSIGDARQLNLDIERQYFMLFGWVTGEDAESLCAQNVLSVSQTEELTHRVNSELAQKGFRILDNKPKHFILRRRKDGSLLHRHGKLVYVQIDFELLQRTEAYKAYLTSKS